MKSSPDDALHYPATARNRDAILEVLRSRVPDSGIVLEIASGSGEHIVHFARALPALTFQPSDIEPEALRSIAAHTALSEATNIDPPVEIDVTVDGWETVLDGQNVTAITCANMIHIAPWAATVGLLRGAGVLLPAGGVLCLYGPFHVGGQPTAPSNAAFDASLRARDQSWGVRNLEDVVALGKDNGFGLKETVEMPANNLSVFFERA